MIPYDQIDTIHYFLRYFRVRNYTNGKDEKMNLFFSQSIIVQVD
jgi:hypothetical protein